MKRFMSTLRFWSPIVLTVIIGLLYWLRPDLSPQMFGASTPEGGVLLSAGIFIVLWLYMLLQGYPIAHGDIGSSSAHNLDNILSWLPGIAALFGIFLTLVGFWRLSMLNLTIAALTLAVVWYDLWINGGTASQINRLTDEIKAVR